MWAVVATYLGVATATRKVQERSRLGWGYCAKLRSLFHLPHHLWGLATMTGVGTVAMFLLGRPDDIITNREQTCRQPNDLWVCHLARDSYPTVGEMTWSPPTHSK